MLTNKELEQYISQETSVANSNHLLLENPKFAPYSFDLHGITGKVDEDRIRSRFWGKSIFSMLPGSAIALFTRGEIRPVAC